MAYLSNNSDSSFGPVSDSRAFDFTLLFEDTILTIVPATLFVVAAGARALWLSNKPNKVAPSFSRLAKLVLLSAFVTTQLVVLLSKATNLEIATHASIAASALDFTSACILFILSCFEHSRSIKPSTIIGLYLLLSVPFDAVRIRTHYLLSLHAARDIANFLSLTLAIKCAVLVAEAVEKRAILLEPHQNLPPEATSGIYNRSIFWWLNPILKLGFGKTLHVDDLFSLDEELTSVNAYDRFRRKWESTKHNGRHSLLFATGRLLAWQLFISALPRIIVSATRFSQPFLTRTTIKYVSNRDNQPASTGWGLVGAYFLVFFLQGISSAAYQHLLNRCATQIRGGIISLIFQKTLRLRVGTIDPTASLTLMSSDIQRMVDTFVLIHDTWISFIDVCIAMFLLYLELGRACYAPAIVVIAQIVGTGWITKVISRYQKRWLDAIQTRISFTSTLLHSMRNVKLLGLSRIIEDRIQALRLAEINECKKFRVVNNYLIFLQNAGDVFAPFATFLVYFLQARASHQPLNLATSFGVLTILRLINAPLNLLCNSAPNVASSIGCFERIQQYLNADSWQDDRISSYDSHDLSEHWVDDDSGHNFEMRPVKNSNGDIQTEAIVLKSCSFGWRRQELVVRDIDVSVKSGSITMIIGPVGCGKSTLLKGILSETPEVRGFVYLRNRSMAFADQEPWIQNGTIRDTICGPRSWENQPLDSLWYQEVLSSCGLIEDLNILPERDMTLIGSKGISLSGGQKQRLALARALYSKAEVLLLDDVFSGLDNDTEELIFKKLFGHSGPVKRMGITVIMVTHAAHRLPASDMIISLDATGRVTEQGHYLSLIQGDGYVHSLDIKSKKLNTDVYEDETIHTPDEPEDKRPTAPQESDESDASDARDSIRRKGEWSAYKHWFKSAGYLSSVLSFIEALLWMGAIQTPGVLVKIFSNGGGVDTSDSSSRSTIFIVVFGATTAVAAVSLGVIAWQIFIDMVPRSSRNLHLDLLQVVLNAPLSFFSRTDIGTITNRFSQDIGLIDTDLPYSYADFILSFVACIAGLGLMVASGSGYFAATIPPMLISLYFVQRYYLRTSRQMRLLDIEYKAPLYTLFGETAAGLPTIRAFGWTEQFAERSFHLLDRSQRPFYFMFCIQRWLALVLDMVVVVLVTALLVIIVTKRSSMDPGLAGLGLLSTVSLSTSLTRLVKMWSALETSIGAISRLRDFLRTTTSEHKAAEVQPIRGGWPENGEVEFLNFSASYSEDSDLVLKEIDLRIRLGESIGVCGRSGSGKSSMLASIFHLLEFRSGQVRIDGVDMSTIPREALRARLNVIPQEPWWVTTETVRFNMDPWNADSATLHPSERDTAFISALTRCQVWHIIQEKGGLDATMTQDFLSHGQRQLFCLARAMVRESKVVVLDEVSANVDVKTDELMQQVIREHFDNCTIIAVAHRLNTIVDSDRVVVLSQGKIVEVGEPKVLLTTPGSRFKDLYEK